MKFLVDMNLSPRWIAFLSESGWHATHWSGIGNADATDSEILSYAAANDYVVLTHDLDFGAILAITHGKKPSVVQIRSGTLSPETIAKQIVAALQLTLAELESGALLTIEPERTRVRLLPCAATNEAPSSLYRPASGGRPTLDPPRPLGCPILAGLVYARVGLGLLREVNAL